MNMLTCARECGRLDYLGSQEPGDSSQANAIEVVDKLLVEDDSETSQKVSMDKPSGMKSATMLAAEVAQCLAKKVEYNCSFEKPGVFDWVDSARPENGTSGNFSRRKHEAVFKNQVKNSQVKRFSGSGVGTKSRDLLKCIAEEPSLNYLEQQAEPISAFDGTYDAYYIGPNTQMAAEAMEALVNAPTVSYDAREDAPPDCSIMSIDAEKEVETDNASSVHSSVQKLVCLPHSSARMATRSKQSNVVCTRLNEENSSSLRGRSSKSTVRMNVKQMPGKAKRSKDNEVLTGNICHEGSERITGPNPSFPHLLDQDTLVHPKRKRTHMFTSGNLKIDFNQGSKSISVKAKTTKVMQPSAAQGGNRTNENVLPNIIDGVKRKRRSYLTNQRVSAASSTDASDGALAIVSKDRVLHKEVSHSNQVAGSLLSNEQEKQSAPQGKVQHSSLAHATPLREINNTLLRSRMRSSGRPSKKGFSKSPGFRELASLVRNGTSSDLQCNGRRKKDMSTVRCLFSQHMDQEIIKQQRKILARFGVPLARSIAEATHFITDKFARTRNMLEAIAMGKPVVTPMWLECCGLARCFIDEKKYILRDLKKEKEIGFSMPVSLSHACQNPLLEGTRVLITPNAKPGQELLKSLVVAAHGQPLERITGPMLKDKNFVGAFAISCEEDYNICLPLIKKGLEVFDSELLLNGIVIQKLQFDRHCLFGGKTI